ncbi:6663_t:CDS:2 [Acaulospora colombiana]|uniref:6663_t:CDS:1 n=1 Tax=Acaulospora colombiana TaxID=27376 RepID=A0ACA9NBH8_9GLOM|nr:6663_t:CDS:2 [Acaulospora colombiana]
MTHKQTHTQINNNNNILDREQDNDNVSDDEPSNCWTPSGEIEKLTTIFYKGNLFEPSHMMPNHQKDNDGEKNTCEYLEEALLPAKARYLSYTNGLQALKCIKLRMTNRKRF